MTRPRIKTIRERLALWVAPWLVRPFARGGIVKGPVVLIREDKLSWGDSEQASTTRKSK